MIATRFRAVAWAAGVAAAALSCYLVSLQVASERANLMKTERRILAARADIRQLRTELDTRSRMVQLERWNSEVLGLQAPQVTQYAAGAVELAGYVVPKSAPQVVQVAAVVAQPAAPVVTQVAAKTPAPAAPVAQPAVLRQATFVRPETAQPLLHRASLTVAAVPEIAPKPVASVTAKPARTAGKTLLGDDLLGDIGRAAAAEARKQGR